jgi:hypothetical protein
MLALLVRRRAGRRIQPRSAGPPAAKPARPAQNHFRQKIRRRSSPEPARIMVAAAGQRDAAPRCNPDSTPGISPLASVTAPAVLSWRGWSRRARTAAEAVLAPRPRPEQPRPAHPEDRHQHPPRQATPAGGEQPAHEQVICAVGTANTYRMSRHSYSAIRRYGFRSPSRCATTGALGTLVLAACARGAVCRAVLR